MVHIRCLMADLIKIGEDFKTGGWDGYDASPVLEQTISNAKRIIRALPKSLQFPTVGAECDGHITLEWYRHPHKLLSVSVGPDGFLYYAALIGDQSFKGKEFFNGTLSQTIAQLAEKVQEI